MLFNNFETEATTYYKRLFFSKPGFRTAFNIILSRAYIKQIHSKVEHKTKRSFYKPLNLAAWLKLK